MDNFILFGVHSRHDCPKDNTGDVRVTVAHSSPPAQEKVRVDRLARAAMPHISGSVARLMWGPTQSQFTTVVVLKALQEAIAVTLSEWQARAHKDLGDIDWYVDAAQVGPACADGLWRDTVGARVWKSSSGVKKQHVAEWDSIECELKTATYQGTD